MELRPQFVSNQSGPHDLDRRAYIMVAAQEAQKHGRTSGIKLGVIDPVKYAEAFGARGLVIQSSDRIAPVLKLSICPGLSSSAFMSTIATTTSCSNW